MLDENGAPTGIYNVEVNGEAAVMSEDEIRSAYDELKARVDEERAVAAERGRSERETARNEEEYRQQVRVGDDVTFVRDGKRISGRAVMDYDEDSLIVDVDDGARTRSYNVRREEIVAPGIAVEEEETPAVDDNALQEDTEAPATTAETETAETVAPAPAENGTTTSAPSTDEVSGGQETPAPSQAPATPVQAEQQRQVSANGTTTPANTPASAQDIVSDKNTPMPINEDTGEPDYARATPERTREFLYNESGLYADEADAYVENNAEQAREELEKAKGSKPKMEKGKTLTQFLSEKAAWQQQMDEAQRNVDYWEGVKNAGQETAPGMPTAQDTTNGAAPVGTGAEAQNMGQTDVGNAVDAGEQRASLRRKSLGVDAGNAQEMDENGLPFIKASNGTTNFGEIREESGLQPAPIRLSVGFQNSDGKGYGLAHIEDNHGKQIRNAGFSSVKEFVEFVAQNYDEDNIRVGNRRKNGSTTYLIQVQDKHDNTLYIEMSRDGSYWNVNSAGIFRKGYSNKKETVAKTEPQQPNNAISDGSSLSTDEDSGITSAKPNGEPTVSADKDSESSVSDKNNTEKVSENQQESAENAENNAPEASDKSDEQRASLRRQKSESSVSDATPKERALRDALNDVLTSAGIDVVTDVEEG